MRDTKNIAHPIPTTPELNCFKMKIEKISSFCEAIDNSVTSDLDFIAGGSPHFGFLHGLDVIRGRCVVRWHIRLKNSFCTHLSDFSRDFEAL